MTTITIKGRIYQVDYDATNDVYTLTGKRGANYHTMRWPTNPEMLFLCRIRCGVFQADPLGPQLWLTDRDGTLRLMGRRYA